MNEELITKAIAWFHSRGYETSHGEDDSIYVFLENIDDMNVSVEITQEEIEYRAELWDELQEEELS